MIKIELKNAIKEKNIYLHKQYIRESVLEKLETYLSGTTKNQQILYAINTAPF